MREFHDRELAARHDLAIALEGNPLTLELELAEQPGDIQRRRKRPGPPIDCDFNHFRMLESTCKANPSTRNATPSPALLAVHLT